MSRLEDTMVRLRPSTNKSGSCRVRDQYLDVVMPSGEVLQRVTDVRVEQPHDGLTLVTVSLYCAGFLPATDV